MFLKKLLAFNFSIKHKLDADKLHNILNNVIVLENYKIKRDLPVS